MWRRLRGTVCAACLVFASIAIGIVGVQMQASAQAQGLAPGAATPAATDTARALPLLAKMHQAAQREVQLGGLAEVRGARPETRRYGAELAATFRAFDGRVIGVAARLGLSEQRLTQTYAGENVAALRRDAENLARLGSASGPEFDRSFWASLAHEQSAASDLLAAAAGVSDTELLSLVVDMSDLLDRSSRRAVAAAEAVSGEPARGSGAAPRREATPASSAPPTPAPAR